MRSTSGELDEAVTWLCLSHRFNGARARNINRMQITALFTSKNPSIKIHPPYVESGSFHFIFLYFYSQRSFKNSFRILSGFFQDFQESRPRIWSRSRGIPYNSSRIVRVTQRLSRIPSRISVSIIVKYCPDCPVSSKGFHQDLPNSAHFKEMAPNSNWPISTHHHPI